MNNDVQNINRDMGRSFSKFGLILICIALAVFGYKYFFGFRDVRLYETYDNCTVKTWTEQHRDSEGDLSTYYYVKVVREDPDHVPGIADDDHKKEKAQPKDSRMKVKIDYKDNEDVKKDQDSNTVLFSDSVPRSYYMLFTNYQNPRVTMYTTDWGRHYPVSTVGCSKKNAELEYRKLDPPTSWYFLVGALAFIGFLNLSLGAQNRRVANNYSSDRVYEPEFAFSDREDALVGMATARIRREKEEEYRRKRRKHGGFDGF